MAQSDHTPEESDPVGAVRSALDHIQREEEFQVLVHQLAHQGLDLADEGRIDEVEQVFSEALALARSRNLPRWEAQILFNTGVVFDRSAKPVIASGYFERALALFVEHGPLRMVVNVGTFLGNMLWKTGEPARAVEVLQQALGQAHLGYETKQINPHEYQVELFGVYNELVHAYYVMGQYPRALETYKRALSEGVPSSLEVLHDLDLAVLDLYRDIGAFQHAVEFGKELLERSGDPQTAQDFQFVSRVSFSLGIAHRWRKSMRHRCCLPKNPITPYGNPGRLSLVLPYCQNPRTSRSAAGFSSTWGPLSMAWPGGRRWKGTSRTGSGM